MSNNVKKFSKPIGEDSIYKFMLIITFAVAGAFFIINIIRLNLLGMIVIGGCLLVLGGALLVMKLMKIHKHKKQLVVCVMLMFLVFVISLFSGDFYSDDFTLYLAVIALSGMYLEPTVTKVQTVLVNVLLALQYIINPGKADPLSQYIMCMVLTTLTAIIFLQLIKRGRSFIQVGIDRNEEAEELVASITKAGTELQQNCETSAKRVEDLKDASDKLEERTQELKDGSDNIIESAKDIVHSFDGVHETVKFSGEQISIMNTEVKHVEDALAENKKNMQAMSRQMNSVKTAVDEANEVFAKLQKQILEISAVTDQLNSIAASTNMLALNASIEAARAGQSGAGFAVVASKVQELAVDSNRCSGQVVEVVTAMQSQIEITTEQLGESTDAIDSSIDALEGLQNSFDDLTTQFQALYDNIEAQNENVVKMDSEISQLETRINEMSACTEENQAYVDEIANVVGVYKNHMKLVVADTQQVNDLSVSMLSISKERGQK